MVGDRECLVLGVEGAGKTLLLRRLWELSSGTLSEIVNDSTAPTVGQDVIGIRGRNGMSVNVREIGGRMGSAWMSYTDLSDSVVFMVDISDAGVLAASAVLMQELLLHISVSHKRVLLVLNKRELIDDMHFTIAFNLMRITDISALYPELKVECITGSLYDLQFVNTIYLWITSITG